MRTKAGSAHIRLSNLPRGSGRWCRLSSLVFRNQLAVWRSTIGTALGRFCCKSLFALAIKISFGCTGDFHVNMWGTSLSEEKLAGDPGNVIEATSIGGRWSDFFYSRKISAGQFGTFATISAKSGREQMQHNLRKCAPTRSLYRRARAAAAGT